MCKSNQPPALCRAEAPKVSLSAGQLSIAFPVRTGIPLDTVYNAVTRQLDFLSGSVSVQVTFRHALKDRIAWCRSPTCLPINCRNSFGLLYKSGFDGS